MDATGTCMVVLRRCALAGFARLQRVSSQAVDGKREAQLPNCATPYRYDERSERLLHQPLDVDGICACGRNCPPERIKLYHAFNPLSKRQGPDDWSIQYQAVEARWGPFVSPSIRSSSV